MQFCLLPILLAIRETTDKAVPIYSWDTGAAFATLRLFSPEKYGGLGDIQAKASALAERTGRNIKKVLYEVTILLSVIRLIPGY